MTPVVLTKVKYQPDGADGGEFYGKVPALSYVDADQDTQRLTDGLEVGSNDIMVTEQFPSVFFGKSLAAMLHWMKIDTLVIGGLTTSRCVRATCIDRSSHGLLTLIANRACGHRSYSPQEANLYDLSAKYADLIAKDDAIGYVEGSATTLKAAAACKTRHSPEATGS